MQTYQLCSTDPKSEANKHYHVATLNIKATAEGLLLVDDVTEYRLQSNDMIHVQQLAIRVIIQAQPLQQVCAAQSSVQQDPLQFLFRHSRDVTRHKGLR